MPKEFIPGLPGTKPIEVITPDEYTPRETLRFSDQSKNFTLTFFGGGKKITISFPMEDVQKVATMFNDFLLTNGIDSRIETVDF